MLLFISRLVVAMPTLQRQLNNEILLSRLNCLSMWIKTVGKSTLFEISGTFFSKMGSNSSLKKGRCFCSRGTLMYLFSTNQDSTPVKILAKEPLVGKKTYDGEDLLMLDSRP